MVNVHYTKRKPKMKCKSKTFSCRGQKEVNLHYHFIFAEPKCDGMSHPHPTEHRSCPTTSEAAVASTSKIRVPLQPEHNVIEPSSSGVCVLSDTDSGVADTASEDGRSASRASAASKKMSSSDLQPLRDPEHYEELSVIGNGKHCIGGFTFSFFCFFIIFLHKSKVMGHLLLRPPPILLGKKIHFLPARNLFFLPLLYSWIFYMRTIQVLLTSRKNVIAHEKKKTTRRISRSSGGRRQS